MLLAYCLEKTAAKASSPNSSFCFLPIDFPAFACFNWSVKTQAKTSMAKFSTPSLLTIKSAYMEEGFKDSEAFTFVIRKCMDGQIVISEDCMMADVEFKRKDTDGEQESR